MRLLALRHQPFVTVDGTEYIRLAEALASGRGFASIFPPGYPALIALARWVAADRVLVAQIVSLVCGALLPWPVLSLARRASLLGLSQQPRFGIGIFRVLAPGEKKSGRAPVVEAAYLEGAAEGP